MRDTYRNGDDVMLQYNGCDGCTPCTVNSTLCHEHGCPDGWRDYERECRWCGSEFYPETKWQAECDESCAEAMH